LCFFTPYLGYFITFLRSLPSLIIFIIAPVEIIISDEIANIKTEVARIATAKKAVVKNLNKKPAKPIKK